MDINRHIRMSSCPYDDGFTLPEALVAILIIAMIMLAAQNFLTGIAASGKRVSAVNDETSKMMRFTMNLNRDLMEMVLDEEHPFSSSDEDGHCLTRLRFFTRNRANPDNDYLDPVYQVIWSVRDGDIRRHDVSALTEGLNNSIYPGIKCIEFKKYTQGNWTKMEHEETSMPAGLAWKARLQNDDIIEQIIPEKQEHADTFPSYAKP